MALRIPNSSPGGSVGLDIDGSFLAAVEANGERVQRAVSMDLPAGVVSDGEVADADQLAAALKDFFKHAELPKTVRLGVANQQIVVRQVELPPIEDPTELEAAVRFQAAEAIAMPLDEAVLDHQVVGRAPSPEGGERMQVVIVAARQSMIATLLEAVRGAGLKPESIDLDAFALVRTLADENGDGTGRVFCHLSGVTNLAIALGRSCPFARTLATRWDGEGDYVASALADEIRLSIDYYLAQAEARPAGEVVISGPGARKEGLAEELGTLVGLPVVVAEPLRAAGDARIPPDEDPSRHTVAIGLALGEAA